MRDPIETKAYQASVRPFRSALRYRAEMGAGAGFRRTDAHRSPRTSASDPEGYLTTPWSWLGRKTRLLVTSTRRAPSGPDEAVPDGPEGWRAVLMEDRDHNGSIGFCAQQDPTV